MTTKRTKRTTKPTQVAVRATDAQIKAWTAAAKRAFPGEALSIWIRGVLDREAAKQ